MTVSIEADAETDTVYVVYHRRAYAVDLEYALERRNPDGIWLNAEDFVMDETTRPVDAEFEEVTLILGTEGIPESDLVFRIKTELQE